MKKMTRLLLAVFLILMTSSVISAREDYSLIRQYLLDSEVIVEGIVQQQFELPRKEMPIYVGQAEIHTPLGFGMMQKSYILVTKVYKGNIVKGSKILVYTYPKIHKTVVQLKPDKKYVLFLNGGVEEEGYTIVERGKAHWLVFDYNGIQKVKSWQQYCCYRDADAYEDYEKFISELGLQPADLASDR